MRHLKPPTPIPDIDRPSVFLAGSIDMDHAPRWQDDVAAGLADLDVLVLNPRRDDWDSSWGQTIDDPRFRGQVEWELEGLERTSLIAMVLSPGSQSPISLLELGLHATSDRMIVCCPEGFWRKGNVDIVCRRHSIPTVDTLEELIETITARLTSVPPSG